MMIYDELKVGREVIARPETELFQLVFGLIGKITETRHDGHYLIRFGDYPEMLISVLDIYPYEKTEQEKIEELGTDPAKWALAFRRGDFHPRTDTWFFRQTLEAGMRKANEMWPYTL